MRDSPELCVGVTDIHGTEIFTVMFSVVCRQPVIQHRIVNHIPPDRNAAPLGSEHNDYAAFSSRSAVTCLKNTHLETLAKPRDILTQARRWRAIVLCMCFSAYTFELS